VDLRTDDDIYRARLTYLGPPGYTLPVHLPYAQWGLFAVLVPLYMAIHSLVMWQRPDIIPGYEIALAMVTASVVFRHVNPDRPARQVIRTALTDWHQTKTVDAHEIREPTLRASNIRIRTDITEQRATTHDVRR
jgi:hypothetical protein